MFLTLICRRFLSNGPLYTHRCRALTLALARFFVVLWMFATVGVFIITQQHVLILIYRPIQSRRLSWLSWLLVTTVPQYNSTYNSQQLLN